MTETSGCRHPSECAAVDCQLRSAVEVAYRLLGADKRSEAVRSILGGEFLFCPNLPEVVKHYDLLVHIMGDVQVKSRLAKVGLTTESNNGNLKGTFIK